MNCFRTGRFHPGWIQRPGYRPPVMPRNQNHHTKHQKPEERLFFENKYTTNTHPNNEHRTAITLDGIQCKDIEIDK